MRLIVSLFTMFLLSMAVSFGCDVTPLQAGLAVGGGSIAYTAIKRISGFTVPGFAMEVVTDLTGVTEKSGIRIFKPINGIGFYVTSAFAATEKIKLDLVNSSTGKIKSIIPNVPVHHLMELSCQSEGIFKKGYNESFGSIDITPDGKSYKLGTGDYFNLELTGLDAAKTYDIFGMEAPLLGDKLLKYDYYQIPIGELSRTYNVKGSLYCAVCLLSLERIKVFGEGFATEMKLNELKIQAYKGNDIVREEEILQVRNAAGDAACYIKQPMFGYNNYFMIGTRFQKNVFENTTLNEVEVVTDGLASTQQIIVWEQ